MLYLWLSSIVLAEIITTFVELCVFCECKIYEMLKTSSLKMRIGEKKKRDNFFLLVLYNQDRRGHCDPGGQQVGLTLEVNMRGLNSYG